MDDTIIKEYDKKYAGKWVALTSFNDKTIVSYGKSISRVFEMARKKGYKNPVIFYVPECDTQIYPML